MACGTEELRGQLGVHDFLSSPVHIGHATSSAFVAGFCFYGYANDFTGLIPADKRTSCGQSLLSCSGMLESQTRS